MAIYAYRFFSGGTCREAMTTYQQILGGTLEVMAMADAPPDAQMPGAAPDSVMHATLTLPDGGLLMASDDPTGDGGPTRGVALSVDAPDLPEARRVFDALAHGGEVHMPMGATFWSPGFGMCVDRYGTSWMVSVDEAPSA